MKRKVRDNKVGGVRYNQVGGVRINEVESDWF